MSRAAPGPTLALRHAAPVLCARPGRSAHEAAVAASAMAASAAAFGAAPRAPRWWHVLRGAELIACDPAQAMALRGVPRITAAVAAARIALVEPAARRRHAAAPWVGLANAYGVPEPEHPRLRRLGELACFAAAALGRIGTDVVDLHTLAEPATGPGPRIARANAIAAAPLGRGALDDDEVLALLGATGAAFVGANPGIEGAGAPGAPTTVCVRAPPEHPGVPFAFVPLVATGRAALAGLLDGSLLDAALAAASAGRYDVTPPPAP